MSTVKPLKLCKKCRVNYCLTGYCTYCREKDATARTIKAREIMDREKEVTKDEHARK